MLSLIGKLYTTNTFNIGAMKSTFKNVWKPARRLVIKELDQNLFIFEFFSKVDKEATKDFAECLANSVGKFVHVDVNKHVGIDKSLNFIADTNITKPLRKGVKVKVTYKLIWFDLLDFCNACGKLGHIYEACELFDEEIPAAKLPYGPNLRASPIKSKIRGWECAK
ncbi:hypothetical protein Cgig2_033852 [Carnegiea gigantea]|uniref:DUF4283 domain-containing protein n=1 Tax=Carnegiea gigantea TaxID=171969 RepID=A0A9Q1JKR1_9CARY|nr:hypothetical protein Cgig2_033852 [Carnegiea gigantea]